MTRSLWSLVAIAASLFVTSGCHMCEHCLDYDYPAFGGSRHWQADDHCRAGSAFCGHPGIPMGAPAEDIGRAEPAPPYDAGPRSGANSVMTPPAEDPPPADLTPPSNRLRPSGNDPLPRTGTPTLPESDLPPLDEGPIPDPFDR